MATRQKTGGRRKGSRNKTSIDVKTAAQAHTTEAVHVLADIMRHGAREQGRALARDQRRDR